HLQAVHAVFPEIPLCPTGGGSAANMRDYFAAGAAVVGIGNNVIDHKALAAGDHAQVKRHAQQFLELGQGARGGRWQRPPILCRLASRCTNSTRSPVRTANICRASAAIPAMLPSRQRARTPLSRTSRASAMTNSANSFWPFGDRKA